MPNIKPKLNSLASFGIPEFRLDGDTRRKISEIVGSQPEAFYQSIENRIAEFIAENEYIKSASRLPHVKTALDDIGSKSRELAERLNALTGIDERTRQLISQTWALRGMSENVIDDCEKALWDLWTAIEVTKSAIKGKGRKGRKSDTKLDFACEILRLLRHHKIESHGKFQNCLLVLFDAAHETTEESNIHGIALAAINSLQNEVAD